VPLVFIELQAFVPICLSRARAEKLSGDTQRQGPAIRASRPQDRRHALKDERMNTPTTGSKPTGLKKPTGFQKPTSPQALQNNARLGATQVKNASREVNAAAAEASDLANKTCASMIKSANDYNAMVVDFTLVNANHAFSFLQKLPSVRSLADFAALSAEHARQQVATWTDQTQRLTKNVSRTATPADNSTKP
jgi:hypothetical protein